MSLFNTIWNAIAAPAKIRSVPPPGPRPSPIPGAVRYGGGGGPHAPVGPDSPAELLSKTAEPKAKTVRPYGDNHGHFERAVAAEVLTVDKLLSPAERTELRRIQAEHDALDVEILKHSRDAVRAEAKAARVKLIEQGIPADVAYQRCTTSEEYLDEIYTRRRQLKANQAAVRAEAEPILLAIAGRAEAQAAKLMQEIERESRKQHARFGAKPDDWRPPPHLIQIGRLTWVPSHYLKISSLTPKQFITDRLGLKL